MMNKSGKAYQRWARNNTSEHNLFIWEAALEWQKSQIKEVYVVESCLQYQGKIHGVTSSLKEAYKLLIITVEDGFDIMDYPLTFEELSSAIMEEGKFIDDSFGEWGVVVVTKTRLIA